NALLRTLAAGAGALFDQLPLKLSNAGEQRGEQATLGRAGVPQRITQRLEGGAGFADAVDQVEQLPSRAPQSVELRHGHRIYSVVTRTIGADYHMPSKIMGVSQCVSGA